MRYAEAYHVDRRRGTVCRGMLRKADAELQIRGGTAHPDPEIRGAPSLRKIFPALWASVWSKNKGRPGPSGPSPASATASYVIFISKSTRCDK